MQKGEQAMSTQVSGVTQAQLNSLKQALGMKDSDGSWESIYKEVLERLGMKDSAMKQKTQTTFVASSKLEDAKTAGGTNGVFASAKGRQLGSIAHSSGYVGQGYVDDAGNYYTAYGALLREDDFFYPPGARISPNGMYYDDGSGWKFAKYALAFNAKGDILGYAASEVTGLAPGSAVPGFEETA